MANILGLIFPRTSDPKSPGGLDQEILHIVASNLKINLNFTRTTWGYYDPVSKTAFGDIAQVNKLNSQR